MCLPPISFSNWTPWRDRAQIIGNRTPGVYALADFKKAPRTIDLQAHEIIYIGESCGSLRKRWGQFNRSAFEGKKGHSGGKEYWKKFQGKKGKRLFISVFPVDDLGELRPLFITFHDDWLDRPVDDLKKLRPLFIRYLERKLILDYALKWDRPPECNRK